MSRFIEISLLFDLAPVSILAGSETSGRTGVIRDLSLTFLLVSLLLVTFFVVAAAFMLVRRRRLISARLRDTRQGKREDAKAVDAWSTAGKRARPYDSDFVAFDEDDIDGDSGPDSDRSAH